MIRQYIKNMLFDSLNYDIFRFEDFNISEQSENEKYIVIFSYDSNYYFQLVCSADDDYCRIEYSPGNLLMKEKNRISMGAFERYVAGQIHEWLDRVKKEILNPIQERFIGQAIQKFKEQLDDELSKVADEFFSKEESEELKKRLDVLEKIVLDGNSQTSNLKNEVEKMKQEIEFLKLTVDTLSKKKWLKNAITKMYTWSQQSENKKLIEAGADVIKKISQIDIPNMNQ